MKDVERKTHERLRCKQWSARDIGFASKYLSDRDRDALFKYGPWLQALARREVEPVTVEEIRFVRVFTDELPPETFYEKLWSSYRVAIDASLSAAKARVAEIREAETVKKKPAKKEYADLVPLNQLNVRSRPCTCEGANPNCCRCGGSGSLPN